MRELLQGLRIRYGLIGNRSSHLAPLGWQHINLTGDYLWDADNIQASDGFRPLRHMSATPLEAAA